jgi:large subunit ribosomal protein L4e
MSRGHKIDNIPELPLVLDDEVESISTTSHAYNILRAVGANDDISRCAASRKIRKGIGKLRGRRYITKKGPLIVFAKDNGVSRAFRNLPGVELAKVESLGILKLAPGGQMGRFLIWSKSAIEALKLLWSTSVVPTSAKTAYSIPRSLMTNSDLKRLINSDDIQCVLNSPKAKRDGKKSSIKKNPIQKEKAYIKLNPHTKTKGLAKKVFRIRDSKLSAIFINN